MESEVAQIPLWQKAWAWFEANKRQTIYGAIGLAAIALVVSFFVYRKDQADIAAGQALSNVALSQFATGNRGNLLDGYLKVAASYPGSRAGARAVLLAAGALFVEGKYTEAKNEFDRFNREYTDSPFRGEALLGAAACLDAQGKSTEAATAYNDLITRRPNDYVLPQARFALARLYESQGKPELARNLFEEVERNSPYTAIANEAGMRLEELKLKYPNLAVAPAPGLTNSAPVQPQKR